MKSCLLLSDQVITQSNFITFSYCFSYDIVFYYSQRSICFLLELFVFLCTIPSLLWNFLWQFPSFLFPICLSHPFVLLCCRPAFPLCTFILFAWNLFIQETFFYPFSLSNFPFNSLILLSELYPSGPVFSICFSFVSYWHFGFSTLDFFFHI